MMKPIKNFVFISNNKTIIIRNTYNMYKNDLSSPFSTKCVQIRSFLMSLTEKKT